MRNKELDNSLRKVADISKNTSKAVQKGCKNALLDIIGWKYAYTSKNPEILDLW